MNADHPETDKKEGTLMKKRTPIFYGVSGCALGFLIMVVFVAVALLTEISGRAFGTILNVGAWVLPIGLGVLGYLYGKSKQ